MAPLCERLVHGSERDRETERLSVLTAGQLCGSVLSMLISSCHLRQRSTVKPVYCIMGPFASIPTLFGVKLNITDYTFLLFSAELRCRAGDDIR